MINADRHEPGKKYALMLTMLVHGLLVGALFLGVQWKRSQPEVMEVELWSADPVTPARLPPPPPPPEPEVKPKPLPKVEPKPEAPKKPDIAIKEEKKKPEPPKKPEPKPEPKKPEVKPEPKAPPKDQFKEMLEREERQHREAELQAKLAKAEAEQRAAAGRKGLESYAAKIRGKVRGNIVLPPGIAGNPEAVFELTQLPSGEVLAVRLKRSSGNPALDTAIERAILKSSPLPKPDDPSQFQRTLEIKYRPFEE
ncbi:MAG: protein TolA [Betaproteobacteria bacterium HGW-Betaproteobacteria-12]|nr:MAG: protein TolA [Betaproteobacteria bacterium HGW-Betaproteobacteria-12]